MKKEDLVISTDLDSFSPQIFGDRRCILIVRCIAGELRIDRHNETYIVKPNDLLICLSDYLVGHYMRTPDFRCRYYACPQQELTKHAYRCLRVEPNWWEKLNYMLSNPILHLHGSTMMFAKYFNSTIDFYLSRTDTVYQEEMLDLLADLALYELLTHINNEIVVSSSSTSIKNSKDELFRKFMNLLHDNCMWHREVQWYASELAISPKYLSAVVHQLTGKKATELINNSALEFIKLELTDTNDDIKQIAFRMKFSSVSFFCKYVRKHLGMSPLEYRAAYS